jgi:hypothetical protein
LIKEHLWLQSTRNNIQPNNTTGYPGVQYINRMYLKKDSYGEKQLCHEEFFAAVWVEYRMDETINVTRHCLRKIFTVNKYGFDEAKSLAIDYRKKIDRYLNSPEHIYIRDRRPKSTRKG